MHIAYFTHIYSKFSNSLFEMSFVQPCYAISQGFCNDSSDAVEWHSTPVAFFLRNKFVNVVNTHEVLIEVFS